MTIGNHDPENWIGAQPPLSEFCNTMHMRTIVHMRALSQAWAHNKIAACVKQGMNIATFWAWKNLADDPVSRLLHTAIKWENIFQQLVARRNYGLVAVWFAYSTWTYNNISIFCLLVATIDTSVQLIMCAYQL